MARRLAGLRHLFRTRRGTLYILLCALLAGVLASGFSYQLYVSIGRLRASVDQANAIVEATGQYVDEVRDAETAQRGYLLTMRPSYLDPFWASSSSYERTGARLEELARRSPTLEAETLALRLVGRQKMRELAETVQRAMRDGQQAALPEVLSDAGKAAMDSVRRHASRINAITLAERREHTAKLIRDEQHILYGILIAAITGVVLLGASALVLLLGRERLVATQEALQLQSERLSGIIEHIPEGVAVFDASDRLLLRNAAFCPTAGIKQGLCCAGTPFDQIASGAKDWLPPLAPGSRPDATPRMSEVRRGERILEVWRSLMPDGGQMLAVADVTRRVQAEAIARQSQKIKSLGQLTGGVAHDFNNLLQVVSANLELLGAHPDLQPSLRSRIAAAQAAVERGARLTRHLLALRPTAAAGATSGRSGTAATRHGRPAAPDARLRCTDRAGDGRRLVAGPRGPAPDRERRAQSLHQRPRRDPGESRARRWADHHRSRQRKARSRLRREQSRSGPGQYVLIAISDTGPA